MSRSRPGTSARHGARRRFGRRALAVEPLGSRLLLAGNLLEADGPPEAECPAEACGAAYVQQVSVSAEPGQSIDVVFSSPMALESRIDDGSILNGVTLDSHRHGPIDLSWGTFSHVDGSVTVSWQPRENLPPGFYELIVDGAQLRNQNGDALAGGAAGLSFETPVYESELIVSEGLARGESFSVPSLVDWNGDALPDLLIGEKTASGDGKVRIYVNTGTAAAPGFSDFAYVQGAAGDLVVGSSGCLGVFPRLVDWNGDGMPELLLGRADGGIEVYRNVNTQHQPRYAEPQLLTFGPADAKQPINVGARATFDVVDWNADGMLDLVAGGFDGRIQLFVNHSSGGAPEFLELQTVQDGGADLVVPSGRASIAVEDLDGDGRQDLLIGNTNGQVLYYANLGANSAPVFDGFVPIEVADQPLDLDGIPRSRPFVGDVNADGMLDLFVGAADGLVRLYEAVQWNTAYSDTTVVGAAGQPFSFVFEIPGREWQNVAQPLDVNGDGRVEAGDVNCMFLELNAPKFHQRSGRSLGPVPEGGAPLFFDVDGDGYCAPLDVLKVINHLNAQPAEGEAMVLPNRILETRSPGLPTTHLEDTDGMHVAIEPPVVDHLMTGMADNEDEVFWNHEVTELALPPMEPLLGVE